MLTRRGRLRSLSSVIVTGLLLAGLAACGSSEGQPDPAGSQESGEPSPSEDPSPSGSTEAKQAVRRALVLWMKADTGTFTQSTTFPGGSITTSGVYELSRRTSKVTAVIESPDGEHYEFRLLSFRGVSYMNASVWSGGLGRCWLRFTDQSVAAVTGAETVAGAGGVPANAVALSYARGSRMSPGDDDVVIGTVDLVTAASMFGSGFAKLFDDPSLVALIEAEFTLVDGEVASWRMSGESLSAALDREGLLDELTDEVRDAMSEVDVDVEYAKVGSTRVDVSPPDPSQTMTGTQMQTGEGCAAAS